MSGSVQSSTTSSTSSSSTTKSPSSSNTQITTDFDIFGVGDSINTSNYVYDGQTVLLVNSSASQNSSSVKGTYFDPTASSTFSWTLTGQSNLSSSFASQALLETSYNQMQNMIPSDNSMPQYTIDLLNASSSGTINNVGSQSVNDVTYYNVNTQTTTMALLGENVYTTTAGVFNSGAAPVDTTTNYSSSGSSSYMFTGNYYYPQTCDVIIVYMVYTINGTDLLNNTSSSNAVPTVTVTIYNRVIGREAMAKGITVGKLYTAGPINLSYTTSVAFNSVTSSYGTNYNIPVLIADNCTKIYATLTLAYIQPNNNDGGSGYYLNQGTGTGTGGTTSGFFLGTTVNTSGTSNCINTAISGSTNTGLMEANGKATTSGHFVVCLSYANGVSTNYAGVNSYCDLLMKNIWRSPISIYNTYSSYSISDMATKQVVVLFGKSSNGATFLVTNSGTPISNITNYAITPLSNFVGLMNTVISYYDSTSSLISFFTDASIVNANNYIDNTTNTVLVLQPLIGGTIINPNSVTESPNMWYMLLQTTNSANMSIDPTSQDIFNNDVGNYFDLQNSSLCSTGKVNYSGSLLNILTASTNFVFANSIYSGETTINNQKFHNLMILPEAQFNGAPISNAGKLSIYAVNNSPFYTASSSTSSSSTRYNANSDISKQTMTVSNIDIV